MPTISPSADADVHVSYYESEKEYYAIDLSGEGVLSITLETDKDWTDYIGTKPSDSYRKLNISVPEGLLHDLTVKTTNENVKVSYIDVAGTMSLDSNGGGSRSRGAKMSERATVLRRSGKRGASERLALLRREEET